MSAQECKEARMRAVQKKDKHSAYMKKYRETQKQTLTLTEKYCNACGSPRPQGEFKDGRKTCNRHIGRTPSKARQTYMKEYSKNNREVINERVKAGRLTQTKLLKDCPPLKQQLKIKSSIPTRKTSSARKPTKKRDHPISIRRRHTQQKTVPKDKDEEVNPQQKRPVGTDNL